MEKSFLLLSLLLVMFAVLSNGPQSAFQLAFAGTGSQNPLEKLLHKAASLVFFTAEEAAAEIKKLGEGFSKELKSLREDTEKRLADAAKPEQVEEIKAEYKKGYDALESKFDKMQEQLDDIATKQKKGGDLEQRHKSFEEQVFDSLQSNKDQLSALKNQKSGQGISFDVKAVGTQMIANYNGGTGFGLTSWDNELARTPQRAPFMRELVRTRPINSMFVAWAEKVGGEGGAGMVAEGVKKPQKDMDFVEASAKVEKIAVFTKASKESLDDITFLRAEINQDLVDDVALKLDQQILSGTGVSPEIKGLNTYAPTLSVTGFPFATAGGGVYTPNRADALLVAAAIIENDGFTPNVAIVNPIELAMMQLTKDDNGNYVLPPFSTANGTRIAGLRVVANRGVALGDFTLGDFNRNTLGIREEINIQIGYENDDFTRNLITILAEMRAVNYIKAQHIKAFRKGSFATVMTAIAQANA